MKKNISLGYFTTTCKQSQNRTDHGGLTASALSYQADDLPLSHMETKVHDSRNIFICDRNIINFQHLPTSLLCSRIQDIPNGISQHVKYNNDKENCKTRI